MDSKDNCVQAGPTRHTSATGSVFHSALSGCLATRFSAFDWPFFVCLGAVFFGTGLSSIADDHSHERKLAFFEQRIRPVLVEHCYECHNSVDATEGELALDWRQGIAKGGESGPSLVAGKPEASLLLKLIRHEVEGREMPSAGPKLSEGTLADFEKWIRDGAADPRDQQPTEESIQKALSWEARFERRKQWWSLQPIQHPTPPERGGSLSNHPIDRFLETQQRASNLSAAAEADAATVLRRLHAIVTGLPATSEARKRFEADYAQDAERAVANKVGELLASEHFGERWARHWMDWFRYSEGHGGQGDPTIENAFEYRDYLIRAFNQDVAYDQLLLEHLAGDLLPNPRVDLQTGINESLIGLAHFRFVEHGFFPVDSLDELVKFTDNQIDVVSKAFLGLTVSCARCHDHKFDAISQRDYYALFGVLASSRPAQRPLSFGRNFDDLRSALKECKRSLAASLKTQWLEESRPLSIGARLEAWSERPTNSHPQKEDAGLDDALPASPKVKPRKPLAMTEFLHPWEKHRDRSELSEQWLKLREQIERVRDEARAHNESITLQRWDLRYGIPDGWQVADGTMEPHSAGELGLGTSDEPEILSVLPAGCGSHVATAFEQASIVSPDWVIPDGAMAANWAGAGYALLRLVPENYPRPGGGLYKQFDTAFDGVSHWFGQKTSFWKERRGYFHLMTRRTATAQPQYVSPEGGNKNAAFDSRGSWMSIREIRFLKQEQDRIKDELFSVSPLLRQAPPNDRRELIAVYSRTIQEVLRRWQTPEFSDEDALLLTAAIQSQLLNGKLDQGSAEVRQASEQLRSLEDSIAASNRSAPGVINHVGFDQPLYPRGNHRTPLEPVPRGLLSALGGNGGSSDLLSVGAQALETNASKVKVARKNDHARAAADVYDRFDLANDFLRDSNPLVARVIVNRLWQRVFGQGLVLTTDNFGATGDLPVHPELLDHLATRIRDEAWSFKRLLQYLLTSRTFRLSSAADDQASRLDPNNRQWTHALVRRVDAEMLRDQMLSISGQLDKKMFGPSLAASAIPRLDRRRGLYVQSKREQQNALFSLFDVPMPTTTRGTRDVTTTPSQSIALLNSPFVWYQAEKWADRSLAEQPAISDSDRIADLIAVSFTRSANEAELRMLVEFLGEARSAGDERSAWTSLAHLIFNMKEFIYLR